MKYLPIAFFLALFSFQGFSERQKGRYPSENFAHAGQWGWLFEDVHGQIFPLALNFNHDPSFTTDQIEVIHSAMGIFIQRALKAHIIDCAFRKAHKDHKKGRTDFEWELYAALSWRSLGNLLYPGHSYIARYWGDKTSVGIGYVDLYYWRDKPLPGYKDRHYLHIALNSDFIGNASTFYLARDAEYWAGVIAHEFLHNLGYTHPTGYKGSFIEEYGNCVWQDGLDRQIPEDLPKDIESYHEDLEK
jgi:hypothetical protein